MIVANNTLSYLLQALVSLINIRKWVLQSTQLIVVFGYRDKLSSNDSIASPEKTNQSETQCWTLLETSFVTIRDLHQLMAYFSSVAVVILPAPIQYHAIQRQQIMELAKVKCYNFQCFLHYKNLNLIITFSC